MSGHQIPMRNITVTEATRDGCIVRTCVDHDEGDAVIHVLYGPHRGYRVGLYKTERGLARAIARVTAS